MSMLAKIGTFCAAACVSSSLVLSFPVHADEPSTYVSDAASEIYKRNADADAFPLGVSRSHPVPYDEHASSFVNPGIFSRTEYSSGASGSDVDRQSSHTATYDEHSSAFVSPGM